MNVSFELAKTGSFITKTRSCAFHPQGSYLYNPNAGVKLAKININGAGWLDTSTVCIMFDLMNTDITAAHRLLPIGVLGYFQHDENPSKWSNLGGHL